MTALTDTRDIVRLEIGDNDITAALFTDDELDTFVARYTSVSGTAGTVVDILAASADACDALANRFARQFDFAEDGQSFHLSQRSAAYRVQAKELRIRSGAGNASVRITGPLTTAVEDHILGGQQRT